MAGLPMSRAVQGAVGQRGAAAAPSMQGHKRIAFRDGGSFLGEFREGVPHGFGTSTDPTGAVYVGMFYEGIPHGRGSHSWSNGHRFVWVFHSGKQQGFVF